MQTPQQEAAVRRYFLWSVWIKGLISLGEVVAGIGLLIFPSLIASSLFIAVWLLTRGLIKVGLIAALLKSWLWAYPASLVVLALFIIYQAYEIYAHHSLIITGVTIFDLIVVYFIWREWRIIREHGGIIPTKRTV